MPWFADGFNGHKKKSVAWTEAAVTTCFSKYLFLKIWQYLQENTCVRVFSVTKLKVFRPVTLVKRDSNTGAYLWISQNF